MIRAVRAGPVSFVRVWAKTKTKPAWCNKAKPGTTGEQPANSSCSFGRDFGADRRLSELRSREPLGKSVPDSDRMNGARGRKHVSCR
jgi:hypothetical protein